jgi:hypothetical protein
MKKRIDVDQFIAQMSEALATDSLAPSHYASSGDTGEGQDLARSDVHFFAHLTREEDDLVDSWKAQLVQPTRIMPYTRLAGTLNLAGSTCAWKTS